MKKSKMVFVCVLLSVAVLGWSQEATSTGISLPELTANIVPFVQLDIMASRNSFLTDAGIADMRQYSLSLAPFYRDFLFEKYRRDPWWPSIMNILTGGIGSYMMGDPLMGTILQGGMAAVYAVSILTLANLIPRDVGFVSAEIGGAVFTAAGAVWPFLYASNWNSKLQNALGK